MSQFPTEVASKLPPWLLRDMTVKWIRVIDNSYIELLGHRAPVISLAVDPQKRYIATASCDGYVRIYSSSTQQCISSLSITVKGNELS
ncbi:unnamed protein product [Soboliphyme baturini]|uniref:WD_REPEATS_REGION domain-containing protein n=1 Tax=Soboliphyme baturini TaxID=241478 RepID=A0A183ILC6_9BILA|nr:unnamed protein product [Soboliphyme baturini]